MAKNRYSGDCPNITPFDREIKKRFFPSRSNGNLTNLRGVFEGNAEANEFISNKINSTIQDLLKDTSEEQIKSLQDKYGEDTNLSSIIDTINKKLARKEELNNFEDVVMTSYADALKAFIKDTKMQDIVKKEMRQAGVKSRAVSEMHSLFKSKIPAKYRSEVKTQLVSLVIQILDRAETLPEYQHFTRKEIIDTFHLKMTNLKGFDCVMFQARRVLQNKYNKLKNLSEQNSTATKNDEGIPFIAPYIMSDEVDNLFKSLLEDENTWEACVYEAKSLFLEAEKIKIGNDISYAEELEEDELDTTDPEKEVRSAEEENPEHWMLKADTISSFNSMSREVRSLLYQLTTGDIGIFGLPSIIDTMRVHQSLMELRGENYCQNSSEFMEILKNTNTNWAQELYNILERDPWKRTAVFNTYRKNHLDYSYNRRHFFFDKDLKIGATTFFRNRSGRTTKVLMGAYSAGITSIAADNTRCLFNKDGNFIPENFNDVKLIFNSNREIDGISLWNNEEGIYDMRVWDTDKADSFTEEQLQERKRDFVITISDILNLHLDTSDIDIITGSTKEFKAFCGSTHEVMQSIISLGGRNLTINSLFQTARIRKHFEKLVRVSKHTITIQERNSPVEPAFRYNKSTYMAHTVPNSLGDNLERLGKYASKGRMAFRQFLEDNFLNCSVFATKTSNGYLIHNYWLNLMYNATDADLSNPTSFVNRLVNECTRGLGTADTEFSNFSEKDNFIFTLNEYLQNSVDSDGKFGATPLFVTGDSNSSRFLTTPILSADEVLNKMVDNVIQEIKRMQMFKSTIEFFDNPDNIDPNSQDYSKRNQIKISEGHGGKTVEEWMQEPEERRPAMLRNSDKFTFFPFLNQYKDNLLKLYRESSDKVEFRVEARKLLEKHLHEMYREFMDNLKAKNIVQEFKSTCMLNPSALGIVNSDGKHLLDASNPRLLWEFYLNSKFNLIQEENLLTIDPGFYKNTEDFQKRFKEVIASGDLLDLEALDPEKVENINRLVEEGIINESQAAQYDLRVDNNNGHQKVRYIDEILTDLDASDEKGGNEKDRSFMQALRQHPLFKSLVGDEKNPKRSDYNKNTLTDGQGWRSFSSYRKLMIMRGEPFWTKAHEEVYQIIKANRAAGRDRFDLKDPQQKAAFQRILDLGVVFQPLKPFYFGFEKIEREDGSFALVPVQHKYSEYPIIPELLPIRNSKDADKVNRLAALGQAMEEDGTDLVCCTTCVKVGGFGSTSIKHCTSKEEFSEALGKGYAHQLNLEGWRQQSNVPEHVDSSRSVGTQFSKHGYGSIAETTGNKHYGFLKRTFPEEVIKLTKNKIISIKDGLDPQNLIQLYGSIGCAHYIYASNKLNNRISNPNEASVILSELRANDSRGAKDNIAAYTTNDNGDMLMSPAEGTSSFDNMASLLSKLRKDVIKRPVKGGSAVQVSAFGFEDVLKVRTKEVDTAGGKKLNIVYAECAVPFAFSYTYEDGTVVDLSNRYLEFVDHNTGMLLDEHGEPVEPEEATDEPGKEFYGWNTKLGKLFPGILDMIAYRIPTEKNYSMLNLKAKRFWPKAAGGTIMVPSQFTTIAGFDFDIDKLYFIRREYKFAKKPRISNYDIWTAFYEESEIGRKIKPYLEEASKGPKYLGKFDYEYWGEALDLMKEKNIDTSGIPKTAEEAFMHFINVNTSRFSEITSHYDPSKTVLENDLIAVNNLFFDYMQARLEDYDTFSERYIPGGFKMLKDAKPIMMALRYGTVDELTAIAKAVDPEAALMELAEQKYKNFSPNYDPTELSTIAHYQTYNSLYDRCISVSAVQNINQRLTALLIELKLKDPILFGSLLKAKDSSLSDDEKAKLGADIRSRFINGLDTELLTTNFLAASVDAVKDALLEFFGIDDRNLNIACLMSKIGCSPLDIGILLNQPVVMRAMELVKEGNGYKSITDSLDEAMQEIAKDNYRALESDFYYSELSGKTPESKGARNKWVETNRLIKNIGVNANPTLQDMDYLKSQFAVVHLMKELQAAAQELSEQVAISQSTSIKSVKSTFGAIQAVMQKVMSVAQKFGGRDSKFVVKLPSQLQYIINPMIRINEDNMEDVLGECIDSPYCMEQIAYSVIAGYAEALGDYFPYMSTGFTALSDGLASLTNRGYLSADIFDMHNKAAMMFFIERMTGMFKESNHAFVYENGKRADTGMPNRIFYTKGFPEFIQSILEINDSDFHQGTTDIRYKDIPILGSIFAELENYNKGTRDQSLILKMEGIGGLNSEQKDNLIESWESMFYSDDPMLRDLAKHLFMYSYYNRGFDFGTTTFMSLAPLMMKVLLEDGEYAEFFNRVFNIDIADDGSLYEIGGNVEDISPKDYYKAFILNTRSKFYQFTRKIFPSKTGDKKSPYSIAIANMKTDKSSFTINTKRDEDKPLLKYVSTEVKDPTSNKTVEYRFTPCIEIDDAVYICDDNIASSTNNHFNVIEPGATMTYYRMDNPLNVDYSKPEIYGTREKMLEDIGKGNLISIIRNIILNLLAELSPSSSDSIDDAGNTYGEEGSSVPLTPITTLREAVSTLLNSLSSAIAIAQGRQLASPMLQVSNAIAALINFSKKHIKRNDKGKLAIDGSTIDTSVSTFVYGEGKSYGAWGTPSSVIGNTADAVGRDFFRGTLKKQYPNMSDNDLANIVKDLTKFRETLDSIFGGRDNYRIMSDDFYITAKYLAANMGSQEFKTMVGAVDLIIYDRQGNIYLCDMKAKRSGIKQEDLQNYSKQLSSYKEIIEACFPMLKGKIKELKILKFNTFYAAPIGERNGTVSYSKSGPYKHETLYADNIPIAASITASYKAPRLTGDIKLDFINATAILFQEKFEAVDLFHVVDIVPDATALVWKLQELLTRMPAMMEQTSKEALIDLVDLVESSIRNNFLIDSLPYLLGEEYREENIEKMFTAIRNSIRNYKSTPESKSDTKDEDLHPMSYLKQLTGVMKRFLSYYKHIPNVVEAISSIESLEAMLSSTEASIKITKENEKAILATIDNGYRILSSPDMLQVLDIIGYTEESIESQFNVAKNILKMRLFGSLDQLKKEGELDYIEKNDGKPLC